MSCSRQCPQWMSMALLASIAVGLGGCHKTFQGSTSQPNPLAHPTETLRNSERIIIITGDMELRIPRGVGTAPRGAIGVDHRYPLHNEASFTVVSRDRLRFHVQIEHKWQDWADIDGWSAYLVDDRGRRYRPEQIDRRRPKHIVSMWDYETRSVVRNIFGDIIHIREDGYKRRQALGSLSVFRGQGDLVFYARDIFTPDVKRLTLVLKRTGTAFSFTWTFDDSLGAPTGSGQVTHEPVPVTAR